MKKPMSAKCFYNGYLSKPEYKAVLFKSLDNQLGRHSSGSRDVLHPASKVRRVGVMR